ncbi:MAG: hypothetical protein WDN44_06885 [Sphingomonas sp.]
MGHRALALRRLLADGDDTTQVFRIMRALNGDVTQRNYRRLLALPQGGRLAYEHVELAKRLADRAWIDSLPRAASAPPIATSSIRPAIRPTGWSR